MTMRHPTTLHTTPKSNGLITSLRVALVHGAITLLAVSIAFSLPAVARYILFGWWPLVEADSNLMLASEVAVASVLVVTFNLAKLAWDSRRGVAMARMAALVYTRNAANGWFARLQQKLLLGRLPAVRDAFILTVTGYQTFINGELPLRARIEEAYELRVMLVNPGSNAIRKHAESLPPGITALTMQAEIEASIAFLAGLRRQGKKVMLKFCDEVPFWKVIVMGEHAWVQHIHPGVEVKQQPEYVFALQHVNPRHGLFVPFYVYVLERWNEIGHPDYDFDTGELVYRDAAGNEIRRAQLGANGSEPASANEVVPGILPLAQGSY